MAGKNDKPLDIETDDDFDVEIEDDTPEKDRNVKPPAGYKPEGDDDDADPDGGEGGDGKSEAEQYSARVQKRINELTYTANEERRQKEATQRERDEAVRAAQAAYAQLKALREQSESTVYRETSGRIEAQIAAVRRELKDAHDEGDTDKIVDAQAKLAMLAAEQGRYGRFVPPKNSPEEMRQQPQQPQYQPPQQPQQPQVTERDRQWLAKNQWFNTNERMKAYAFGVHTELVRSGVAPSSEEYYRQIDAEMRKTFPSEFGTQPDADAPAHVVAPPSRSSGNKPRTVRLTKSQVAIAKKLGVSPQEYAAQLLKTGDN